MSESRIPLVSFVVPCYNYGRFVPDCLASILQQDGDYPFEIIAIDDASSDNTLQILEEIKDPRLRIIRHEKNEGHVKTITQGLRESRGELVARIDPDDRYRSCFLAQTVPIFERHPEVGFAYGDAAVIDSTGRVNVERSDRVHNGRDFKGNELIPLLLENFICAPTVIARRAAWIETLPVPPGLAFSDWYFNVMIARKYDVYYVDRVLADYRVHSQNLHTRTILDRTEEPSILWMLDHVFGLEEQTPRLEQEKQAAKRDIYASHYWTLANKYFGARMNEDARRCYERILDYSPGYLRSGAFLRRYAATCVSREWYERGKNLWRGAPADSAGRNGTWL